LAELLATLPDVEWQPVASPAEFETALASAEAGIVVAPDFERDLTNGNQPDLTVWLNPQPGRQSELADFQRRLMEELWRVHEAQAPVRLTWRPVDELAGPADDDQDANTFLLTMMIITGMAMTGLTISLLIVEEKDARTLDALLLSPAGKAEFIAGKGLAVFLYTLLLMAAMLLISGEPNGAWGATLAAVFLGSLFMVGSGLLLGTVFNTRHQCNAWGGLLTFVLMMPAMLVVWQPSPIWLTLLRLIPTYYLTDALTMSLNQTVILGRLGLDLVVLTGFVLLVFFLTQQRLRGSNWLVG
jgi:ABC-2 type transport system permease protein